MFLNKYSFIREFVSDVNSAYRCVGFKYLELMIREKNDQKLNEIFNLVFNKKLELHSYFLDDEMSRENLRKKFCGYLKYLIKAVGEMSSM